MSKLRVLLVGATAAGAFAAASFIPAHAQDVNVPGVGTLSVDGNPAGPSGHITANGEDANGDYAGGYIVAGNDGTGNADGVCADTIGSPGSTPDANGNPQPNSPSQSCNEEIITSQAP